MGGPGVVVGLVVDFVVCGMRKGQAASRGPGGREDHQPLAVVRTLPVCLANPPHTLPRTAGICRAHGVPHQRVAGRPSELEPALRAAWGLNRHSVVEVGQHS